jgi:hypothetical protein
MNPSIVVARMLWGAVPSRLMLTLAVLMLALPGQAQMTYRWVGQDGRVHYADNPPPPAEIKDLQLRKLKGVNVVDTGGAYAYETTKAAKEHPLTLYVSNNCGEHCRLAREFLARRGAPYTEKLIQSEADATEYRQRVGGSDLIVPVLMAGKAFEKGFTETSWHALLDSAGYPARGNAKGSAAAAAPAALR